MVNTKEERFYFYLVMISFTITAFFVVLLSSNGEITGYTVYPTYPELIPEVQNLANNLPLIQYVEDGAKICIEIVLDKDVNGNEISYFYKIRKNDGEISVKEAPYSAYCDGYRDEDFIIKFPSYEKFSKVANSPTCDKFIESGEYFYYIPSKFMNTGGVIECNEEFQERYCPALYSCIDQKIMAAAKMRCCLPPTPTNTMVSKIDSFIGGENKQEELRLNEEQIQKAQAASGETIILQADNIGLLTSIYFWVFVVIIVSSFAIGYVAVKEEHKPRKIKRKEVAPSVEIIIPPSQDHTLQLRQYIKTCIYNGRNYQEVYLELAKLGWPKDVIDQEFANIAKSHL